MNKLKLATKILAIVIICLISFAGVYVQNGNKMENILKEFTLSKDLKGYREIILKLSIEEGANSDDVLNTENYEKSKSIIQKRLDDMNVEDYNIALDKQTGNIYLQIPENDITDKIVSNITETGNVEVKDSEDENNILISSDKFKKARSLYSTTESGTAVYVELIFNKEGKEQLRNLSENEYKKLPEEDTNTTTEENAEETENEEKTEESKEEEKPKQKEASLYMSGEKVTTTSFEEPVKEGKIQLTIGGKASTDTKTIKNNILSASTITAILNNGILPVKYTVDENQYVKTDIKADVVRNVLLVIAGVFVILLVYLIIKFKFKGVFAAISSIGFVGLYLLLLRYTNVVISLEGIVAGVIAVFINYLIVKKLLENRVEDKKKYYQNYLDIIFKLIPIFVISIIFFFVKVTVLESFGMVMFWGITLMLIYNITVTKHLVD